MNKNLGVHIPPWTVIAFLVFAALALRLVFFNGSIASDDFNYFRFAKMLWGEHRLAGADHQAARLTVLTLIAGPSALANEIGVSQVLNLVLSVLAVVWVGLFCWRNIGPLGAIAATALVAFDPPSIVHAGVLLPEPLLTLFMFGSTVALFRASEQASIRRQAGFVALSGVLVALAYSTKEPGILLGVPAGAYLAFAPVFGTWAHRFLLLFVFGVSFLAVALVDAGALYMITEDLLFKQHGMQYQHNAGFSQVTLTDILLDCWGKIREVLYAPFAYALPFALGFAGWFAIVYRRSKLLPFALSGAFVLVYLLFGSSSFTRYVGVPLAERYMAPVIAYAAVGLGVAVQWLHDSPPWRRKVTVLVGALICVQFVAAVVLPAQQSGRIFFTEAIHNVGIAVSSLPDDDVPIYASPRTIRMLNHVLDERQLARLRPLDESLLKSMLSGYYVLVMRNDRVIWLEEGDTEHIQPVQALPVVTRVRISNAWSLWPRFSGADARDWAQVHRMDAAGQGTEAEP